MKIIKSFSLRHTDLERLDYVRRCTGLTASEAFRRLLVAYTEGCEITGLPTLKLFTPTVDERGATLPPASNPRD